MMRLIQSASPDSAGNSFLLATDKVCDQILSVSKLGSLRLDIDERSALARYQEGHPRIGRGEFTGRRNGSLQ
ncbi:hypothetical protein [Bradyrhizobium brasilense]|uniref:hypothetical protein n=1 Tax=Bradyrhizobium brasilense TaxID=1419277 RepID=UPI00115FF785|nr:hypothetical protein [Bradyrhizobium brasilense]